jgi:RHS repeat-associated protein
VTGKLVGRSSGPNGASTLQDMVYRWDVEGNLLERADLGRGLVERFAYDNRNRLEDVQLNGSLLLDLAYDEVGNIVHKSDVGSYSYDAVRRHAVLTAGGNRYSYDANGNVASANGSTVSWYSYDLPNTISHPGGNYSAFYYGPDRQRYRHVSRDGSTLTETIYAAGGLFERVTQGTTVEYRHYVLVNGQRVAVHERKSGGQSSTTYLLADHLGSTEAITSESGELLARLSYQSFGQRRASDWQSAAPSNSELSQVRSTTSRGFTGHEHLDNLGLIHMNGRAYDAVLGRFLSPDPVTPDLYNPQALNRYSYVYNNPLTLSDPTGFSPADELERLRRVDGGGGHARTVIEALMSHPAVTLYTARPAGSCFGDVNCGGTVRPPRGLRRPPMRELREHTAPASRSSEPSTAAVVANTVLNAVVPGYAASGNAAVAIQNGDYAGAAEWYAVTVGEVALAVLTGGHSSFLEVGTGHLINSLVPSPISTSIVSTIKGGSGVASNPVPEIIARVIPDGIPATTLGRPGVSDVYVTAAEDLAGLNATQIADRLTIPPSPTGFNVIELPTPTTGIASPVFRSDPGFIGGGRTAGGAREFVIENQRIPERARIRKVE